MASCNRGSGYFPWLELEVEYQERYYHELILSPRRGVIKDTIYFFSKAYQFTPSFFFVPPDKIYLNANIIELVGAHMHNFKLGVLCSYPPIMALGGDDAHDPSKIQFYRPDSVNENNPSYWPPDFKEKHYFIYFKDYERGEVRIYSDYALEIPKLDL